MSSSESTNAAAAPDAAAGPASLPCVDLEELESQIQQRLNQVMMRARTVSKSVKHLLQQGKTLTELRQVVRDMVGRQDQKLEELVLREQHLRTERLARIRACRTDVDRTIELRELTLDAREGAWRRYQAIQVAGSTAWFRKLAELQAGQDEQVGAVRGWLTAAEQRWLPDEAPVSQSRPPDHPD